MFERLTPTRIARSIAYRTKRVFKLSAKTDELALKFDELVLKVAELSTKADELGRKVEEPARKIDELASKVDRLVLRIDELIGKSDETSVSKPSYFLSADISAAKEKLLKELAALPYPENYTVSKRWQRNLMLALQRADGLTNPSDLAWFAQYIFDLDPTPITPEIFVSYQAECRKYRERYPELAHVPESSFLPVNEIAVIDGLGYSAKMEQAFNYYEDICGGVGDIGSLKTIVEIGSGYGRILRLMRIIDPSRKFVLIDLPESLFFGYAFLRCNFPDARLHIVSPGETITDLEHFDFVFCPVQLVSNLQIPNVDLVINTYSFGEMPQGCVEYLLRGVEDVLKPRFLYSLNLAFIDKNVHYDTGGHNGEGNDTVMSFGPSWFPRRFVLRHGLEAGLVRIVASAVLERRESSRDQLLAEIAQRETATSDISELAGLRFFHAAWSGDAVSFDKFCESVKSIYQSFGFAEPNLSEIGEVKYLKAQRAH